MTRYSCKAAMLEMIKRYPGESLLKYAKGSLQEDVDVLAAVQASACQERSFVTRQESAACVQAASHAWPCVQPKHVQQSQNKLLLLAATCV